MAHQFPWAELVGGQVVELTPPGIRHGVLALRVGQRLNEHVVGGDLGLVTVDAGFVLSTDPPTVRGPDVAVVLHPRVPSPLPVAFFPGPPDLAVEVLSPDDRPAEVAAKVSDYFRAGTGAVWVIDPQHQTLTAHTGRGAATYRREETLRGEPPLPEFELRLAELFAAAEQV